MANELAVLATISKTLGVEELLENSNDLLQQRYRFAELLFFVFGQRRECFGEHFYAASAAFPEDFGSPGGGCQPDAASIFCGLPPNQAGALKACDDAAHGRRTDLFGVGQFAEGCGPAEDQDREGGKLGRTDAAFTVADAKAAEQVNGGGVQLIGGVVDCR